MLLLEKKAKNQGYKCVAGTDEAGRGPLAGPVVAACVVLKSFDFTTRIDDSKKLTALARQKAYKQIIKKAHIGVGIVYEDVIEEINIHNATILAMRQAFFNLPVKPDLLLIDGTLKLKLPTEQVCIIKGDQKVLSIAAASIIAKVTRDRFMLFYDKLFPEYKFKNHKGYGTKMHFDAIGRYGPSALHRRSFLKW